MGKFGPLLRKLREDADVTMGQLARHLEVTVPYISAIEHSDRAPLTPQNILAAAELIGADAQPLLVAAAEDGTAFKLKLVATGERPMELQVGAALARSWTDLSNDQLSAIYDVIAKKESVSDE
jgi:transcriptional regulator with XRE-family HTH domain